MRKQIMAGNWKMNKDIEETKVFCDAFLPLKDTDDIDIVICPPFTSLGVVFSQIKGTNIELGGQDMSSEKSGAFTGEISGTMLQSCGCKFVILGHSERRTYFKESSEVINKKIHAAYRDGLTPIYCVGETLDEREKNTTFDIIQEQLNKGLEGVASLVCDDQKDIVIAYEPVWAIGTGKVATPDQAQEVHVYIRQRLAVLFGEEKAQNIRIQYGGSVKPDNASSLMTQPDIDGALVGGACLDPNSFKDIVFWNKESDKNV